MPVQEVTSAAPADASADSVLLEMRNITKTFGGIHALRDVSLRCRLGTVHALLGENGAGKSTLIKILSGAYQADGGTIDFGGKSFAHLTTRQALELGIRIIYQELNLLPYMTVAENIFLGDEPRTAVRLVDTGAMRRQAGALLQQLGVAIAPDTPVGELTVAGQQMVEIAKALSRRAELIVMDEPSAILAGHELEQLFATIRSLKEQGVTIIYISHRLNEIFEIADEVTVLKDGAVVGTAPVAGVTRRELVQMMVGRPLEEIFPKATTAPGEVVLAVAGLAADSGQAGTAAVRDVSFSVRAGEIVGVAGMVGSGRTELVRAIFGADPVTGGSVTIGGAPLRARSPQGAIRAGLALVPEDRKTQGLFITQPIRHNISLLVLPRLARWGLLRRGAEDTLIADARQMLSIQMQSADQAVQYLSGGNQQKVVLAKWLETTPKVIIFDEPTRGIDVGAKLEIYHLMRRLADRGAAILMISSDLPEVLGMSDRILVMHAGECVGELAAADASEEKIVELATTGRLEQRVLSA
ncbi:MAG: sugar ABC transporter ATP-binding protein [Hyphomicrobiales bacterium]